MPMELEAAADLVTGAVVSRTVEPDIGEGWPIGAGACLNCGIELLGGHCHGCGQPAHVHRTLGAIGHDIAHGVFHFEGKIWRTLPMLAVKPGQLTRRYIHGERAKFVSPLALFLFSVFLMFAVFESVGGPINAGKSDAEREASYHEELSTQRATIAALEKERETLRARGANTATIDADLKDRRDTLKGVTVGWEIGRAHV